MKVSTCLTVGILFTLFGLFLSFTPFLVGGFALLFLWLLFRMTESK
jgi:hypothetical protein